MRLLPSILAVALILASCGSPTSEKPQASPNATPPAPRAQVSDGTALAQNERLVADAWAQFERRDYRTAITTSDECLTLFKTTAKSEQERRLREGVPAPPTGAVDMPTKQAVFANGLLNDVATAAFIKGSSYEALGDSIQAMAAFVVAHNLPHGRCWDPQGWFWSPAEAATERLAVLSKATGKAPYKPTPEEAANEGPQFATQTVATVRTNANTAGINEVYLIVGNGDSDLFRDMERIVLWNSAAAKVYGSVEALPKLGKVGAIEPGVNWRDPFADVLSNAGIKGGFVSDKLFEIWHPKLTSVGRGERKQDVLLHEHWIGDLCGRAVWTKGR